MTLILVAASVLTAYALQTPPATAATHEQHVAAGQHQASTEHQTAGPKGCCCEQMMHEMHKMMSEMMKMHQDMAAHSSHDAAKDKSQEQPKH